MKSIWTKSLKLSGFLDSREILENSREISLLDLDLEAFLFHFSFSISILSYFHFTFHSRSRLQGFFISLFILEMSEPDFHFTSRNEWSRFSFHFSLLELPISTLAGHCSILAKEVKLSTRVTRGEADVGRYLPTFMRREIGGREHFNSRGLMMKLTKNVRKFV